MISDQLSVNSVSHGLPSFFVSISQKQRKLNRFLPCFCILLKRSVPDHFAPGSIQDFHIQEHALSMLVKDLTVQSN